MLKFCNENEGLTRISDKSATAGAVLLCNLRFENA